MKEVVRGAEGRFAEYPPVCTLKACAALADVPRSRAMCTNFAEVKILPKRRLPVDVIALGSIEAYLEAFVCSDPCKIYLIEHRRVTPRMA